jgi:hypothetical protein
MHDVELWLCTHPIAQRLVPLLDALAAWHVPQADRAPLVDELGALVAAELAGARLRWTPHYDRALRWLERASARDLLEPAWDYGPDPSPCERFGDVRVDLRHHRHLCEQLALAETRGARTLGDAFDLLTIGSDQLGMWFALCPDLEALDRRLRAAAARYLHATRADRVLEQQLIDAVHQRKSAPEIHLLRLSCHHHDPSRERTCALSILATQLLATELDFANVPLALMAELGNPFDPRV